MIVNIDQAVCNYVFLFLTNIPIYPFHLNNPLKSLIEPITFTNV